MPAPAAATQVRDRATLYLSQLGGHAGGPAGVTSQPDVSLSALEKQLQEYMAGSTDRPFDLSAVPKRATEVRQQARGGLPTSTSAATTSTGGCVA